ncbi:hypothetical protein DFH11DRAFT_1841997 [Phellopilus nigrolimitatus]|nr:hypothetical protein DFH11DRAFT_1841997 [Phellopilus nigrolimitatus]
MTQGGDSQNNVSLQISTNQECLRTCEDTATACAPSFQSVIPLELLGEIFYWVCPTCIDRLSAPAMSPLVLSHVCRLWRHVAFATPGIWTYTSLTAPRRSLASPIALMNLWLSHSKTHPLVIDLDLSEFTKFRKSDAVLPTVKALTALAVRLKPILSPDKVPLTVSIKPSVEVEFPHLAEEYCSSTDQTGHFSRGTFQLRVLLRPRFHLGMENHRDFGPHLVHLDLRDHENLICLTIEECVLIMGIYPKLQYLALRVGYATDVVLEAHTLTDLTTLRLSWEGDDNPGRVLDALHAPRLVVLELDGPLPPPDFVVGNRWPHLLSFLARSAPPLRSLELHKLCVSKMDILACLARCVGLERLWLEECTVDERLVHELSDGPHPRAEGARRILVSLRSLGLVRRVCITWSSQIVPST